MLLSQDALAVSQLHGDMATGLLQGMQVSSNGSDNGSGNGTTVFSPMFHLHRRLHRPGEPGHDQLPAHPLLHHAWAQHLQQHQDEHHHPHYLHAYGCQDPPYALADLSHMHQQLEQHQHIIPEASEHEQQPQQQVQHVEETAADEELEYMDFDPLLFIKMLPPLEQV
jgi:hypothetical protein